MRAAWHKHDVDHSWRPLSDKTTFTVRKTNLANVRYLINHIATSTTIFVFYYVFDVVLNQPSPTVTFFWCRNQILGDT